MLTRGQSRRAAEEEDAANQAGAEPEATPANEDDIVAEAPPRPRRSRRNSTSKSASRAASSVGGDQGLLGECHQKAVAATAAARQAMDEVERLRRTLKEEIKAELEAEIVARVKEAVAEETRDLGRRRERGEERIIQAYSTIYKWVWPEMRQVGEEFFDIVEKPHRVKGFADFVRDGERDRHLDEVGPLMARFRIIQTGEHYRLSYKKILQAMEKKEAPPEDTRGALVELAALFMVTMEDEMCPVPLRSLLALGKTTRERARGRSATSFAEVEVTSTVSAEILSRLETYPWYPLVRHLGRGVSTGEDLKTVGHYKRYLRSEVGRVDGLSMLKTHRVETEIGPNDSASNVRGPGSILTRLPRTAGTVTTGARPAPVNFPGITGPQFVSNRCMKCGRKGHKMYMCSRPHPLWSEQNPLAVLDAMSHGRIDRAQIDKES